MAAVLTIFRQFLLFLLTFSLLFAFLIFTNFLTFGIQTLPTLGSRYPVQIFQQMSLDKIPAGSLSPTKPDWKLLRHGNTHCSSAATIYINSNTHLILYVLACLCYSMIIWNCQKVSYFNSALKPLSRLPNIPIAA